MDVRFSKHFRVPNAKLKAGALISVITASIIIALFIGTMLLMLRGQLMMNSQALRQNRLERNLRSSIQLLLSQDFTGADSLSQFLDLYDEGIDSVHIRHYPWGIYQIGVARSYLRQDTLYRHFLIGKSIPQQDEYALYLADDERPLSVSGKTSIHGKAFLPPAGLRKSYIENSSFEGDSIVYGPIANSSKMLPPLQKAILDYLANLIAQEGDSSVDRPGRQAMQLPDTLTQSFELPPVIFYYPDSIKLSETHLDGAIIVLCDKKIHIDKSASLNNILVFAPTITIGEGFNGNGQFFATDSLIVGKGSRLAYPSVLGLTRRKEGSQESQLPDRSYIRVGESTKVEGIVFSHDEAPLEELLNRVIIDENAEVTGELYADGLLELKGIVVGTTRCKRFVLQTSSTYYDNFLLNAKLNFHERSSFYLGSPLIGSSMNRQQVMKWVD